MSKQTILIGLVMLLLASGTKAQTNMSSASGSVGGSMSLTKAGAMAISVKTYGAAGNGSADDSAAVSNAINAVASTGGTVYFPSGTYSVCNVSVPSGVTLIGDGFTSHIAARNCGDPSYLIATASWLANTVSGDSQIHITQLQIDAGRIKGSAIVSRAWNIYIDHDWIYGSTGGTTVGGTGNVGADILQTSDSQGGTRVSASVVNGSIDHNMIGIGGANTVRYNVRVYDPDYRMTDWFVKDNWFDGEGAALVLLQIDDAAGWVITGNHFYGALQIAPSPCIPNGFEDQVTGCDMILQQTNWATIISDNFFEESVLYTQAGSLGNGSRFGPGNIIGQQGGKNHAYFVAAFGNYTNDTTTSVANDYKANAQIIHDYSSVSKILVSFGDTFQNPSPVLTLNLGNVSVLSINQQTGLISTSGPIGGSGGSTQGSGQEVFGTGAGNGPIDNTAPVLFQDAGDGEFAHYWDNGTEAGAVSAYSGNLYLSAAGPYNMRIGAMGTGILQLFGGNTLGLQIGTNGAAWIPASLMVGGGASITSSNALPQVGTLTAGRVACVKNAGPPVVLGYCSTQPDGSGACTCN